MVVQSATIRHHMETDLGRTREDSDEGERNERRMNEREGQRRGTDARHAKNDQ